jgi:Arc/MetJ-type ribon-helix-helix transcriptional regulator
MHVRQRLTEARRYTFYISSDLDEGLKALRERDGISESEAIRRAIGEFLERRGIKTERKRAATRKRP